MSYSRKLIFIFLLLDFLPAKSQEVDFGTAYQILKNNYYFQIKTACSQGINLNRIGTSYWDYEITKRRDEDMKRGTEVSSEYLNVYNSAFSRLMQETCPNVW
jgi:hypothetical protein